MRPPGVRIRSAYLKLACNHAKQEGSRTPRLRYEGGNVRWRWPVNRGEVSSEPLTWERIMEGIEALEEESRRRWEREAMAMIRLLPARGGE